MHLLLGRARTRGTFSFQPELPFLGSILSSFFESILLVFALFVSGLFLSGPCLAQQFPHPQFVELDPPRGTEPGKIQQDAALFFLSRPSGVSTLAAALYLDPAEMQALEAPLEAFASDVERVSGAKPQIFHRIPATPPETLVVVGVLHQSPFLDRLCAAGRLNCSAIDGKWESALTSVVLHPAPGVGKALVIVGSDRRGAAFALFNLSRQMGVSPWNWWADVPVAHHATIAVRARDAIQPEPSIPYRGIFLNDEDWGLRPWAAKKMDPEFGNIGPHTYARVFELLLRLHANSLWPAMHPGTLPFNAVPENAELADRWGIVMGSSHSEALLRDNVGEWNEKTDGPWNYQTNRAAIDAYWEKRVAENGKYENFYTVGMRGVHDTGLEATGTAEQKARLVERIMSAQRAILARHVNPDVAKVPQVIWLYKESLELYRAGMQVPDDVTLGWTDDNYGYLRQLPTAAEQKRSGGSGIYYHVSYWGFPHDYLWLCTTPPALIREEMTKAYDHNARRYWILNVGDLKPAEIDIDYFLQLAWNEPAMSRIDQQAYLKRWIAEQFPRADAAATADALMRYYQLNFVRKPEFMGFNGYNDDIKRTSFNPMAWPSNNQPDQNRARAEAWKQLVHDERQIAGSLPESDRSAFFELVGYPIEASAAQNDKFLLADRSFLDAARRNELARQDDAAQARAAYQRIQDLTAQYNGLESGKWSGILSDAPRRRHVFEMPTTAVAEDSSLPLPVAWAPDRSVTPPAPAGVTGFVERRGAVSIDAAHFSRKFDGSLSAWRILPDLGISPGGSVTYGSAGILANSTNSQDQPADKTGRNRPWLEYDFYTSSPDTAPAQLSLYLLPTFPVDSDHRQRFLVSLDNGPNIPFDLSGTGEWHEDNAPAWEGNVLRNAAILSTPILSLKPGHHTLRFIYVDPGVVLEHLVVSFPGTAPAYPVPPETR